MTVTAKAARLVAYGAPLEVSSVELPEPSDAEVLVDLSYAAVNPVDGYAAAGKVAVDGPLPRTLGGEATGYLEGKPVLVYGGGVGSSRDGVFATAAVVPTDAVFELPMGVALEEAAALGVVGLTAWRVVEIAGIGAGDRVLVLGAGGGVGQSVVSYAASKGAQVWCQSTSAAKAGGSAAQNTHGMLSAVSHIRPIASAGPMNAPTVSSD